MNGSTEDDVELTLPEFLERQSELEQIAAEALPGRVDYCTYPEGYIKQPVYSCMTCRDQTGQTAGVCYSCSISCHTRHELIELNYRRNFRCDCGNAQFGDVTCTLLPNKAVRNDQNTYTDNYCGIYCTCRQSYDHERDSMIQCYVCEDWFHDTCIGLVPDLEDFEAYICPHCTDKCLFFYRYLGQPKLLYRIGDGNIQRPTPVSDTLGVDTDKLYVTSSQGSFPGTSNIESIQCKLETLPTSISLPDDHDRLVVHLFCEEGWKEVFCACPACLSMYKEAQVPFLLEQELEYDYRNDPNDDGIISLHDAGLKALESADRSVVMNGVAATTELISALKEFLEPYAQQKRTVTQTDIQDFFQRIKRRCRVEDDVFP